MFIMKSIRIRGSIYCRDGEEALIWCPGFMGSAEEYFRKRIIYSIMVDGLSCVGFCLANNRFIYSSTEDSFTRLYESYIRFVSGLRFRDFSIDYLYNSLFYDFYIDVDDSDVLIYCSDIAVSLGLLFKTFIGCESVAYRSDYRLRLIDLGVDSSVREFRRKYPFCIRFWRTARITTA